LTRLTHKIHEVLIDVRTGKPFAEFELSPETLPAAFERTTLHMGEEDWQVIKAEPAMAAGYVKTDKLTLTLFKVSALSVKDIL
jgi:hypothetical protein